MKEIGKTIFIFYKIFDKNKCNKIDDIFIIKKENEMKTSNILYIFANQASFNLLRLVGGACEILVFYF